MKKILVFLFCAFSCGVAYATEPTIGKPAPDFTLSGLLQAPANAPTKLSGLRGNIVVIDFWATWCGACRPALNSLSALSEKFANQPVRFLAISSEKRDRIERFLQSNPNKLWTGIDSNSQAFIQYQVGTIPHTVVIDQSGTLLAITDAEEITEERINTLLAGKEVTFKRKLLITAKEIIAKEFKNVDSTALPSIVFKPCQSANGMSTPIGKPRFTAVLGITDFIRSIYQIPYRRLVDSLQSEQMYYLDIFLSQPDPVLLRSIMKNVVESSLNISVRIEKQTRPVAVLQRKSGSPALLPSISQKSEFSFGGNDLIAVKQPVLKLVDYLNDTGSSKALVVDETGLKGEYDLSMSWEGGKKEELDKALAKLGLELVSAEREIEMYVLKQKSN